MASPVNQHCASCIGTLSLPISLGGTVVELLVVTKVNRTDLPKRQNNYENNNIVNNESDSIYGASITMPCS